MHIHVSVEYLRVRVGSKQYADIDSFLHDSSRYQYTGAMSRSYLVLLVCFCEYVVYRGPFWLVVKQSVSKETIVHVVERDFTISRHPLTYVCSQTRPSEEQWDWLPSRSSKVLLNLMSVTSEPLTSCL